MKMTVSVPDELWTSVFQPGQVASHVVQEALRLLAPQRSPAEPFASAPPGSDLAAIEAAKQALIDEATELWRAGYQLGIETVGLIPWSRLESFATSEEIAQWLFTPPGPFLAPSVAPENPSPFDDGIEEQSAEYGTQISKYLWSIWTKLEVHPLAARFNLRDSLTIKRGIAQALFEMKTAVQAGLAAAIADPARIDAGEAF